VVRLDYPAASVLQTFVAVAEPGMSGFSSQILAALVVGLLTAFAFQLLLTTFGVAVGITALGFRTAPQPDLDSSNLEKGKSAAQTISKIGTAAGLGILTTVNTVLFAACFLAAKFTQIGDPVSGAIVGIVIWSGYFLILTWISSAAVTSLVSSILGSATAGFRQIVSLVGNALQGQEDGLTEEGAIALVRQEVRSALKGANLEKTVQEYLETVSPASLDLTAVQQGLSDVLQELDLETLAESGKLHEVNHQTFRDVINQHTSLAPPEAEVVAHQLATLWQQRVDRYPQTDLTTQLSHFFQTADPAELTFDSLKAQLEEWSTLGDRQSSNSVQAALLSPLAKIDFKGIAGSLLNRVDLSDLDLEEIWGQVQRLRQNAFGETADKSFEPESFSTLRADLEDYLLNAYPWQLTARTAKQAFQDVLYDPEAAPEQMRSQLEQVQQSDFLALLEQREDLTAKQMYQIAERLEKVRLQVLETVAAAERQEQEQYLHQQLGSYLQSVDKTALASRDLVDHIKSLALAIRPEALETLSSQAAELLEQRADLTAEEVMQVAARLQRLSDRLIHKSQALALPPIGLEAWQKVASYLRHTSPKKLTPERIERKLHKLLQGIQEEASDLDLAFPDFDRQELSDLLDRRKSLDEKQREQILEQVESIWKSLSPDLPSATQTLSISDQIVDSLKTYLAQLDNISEGIDLNSIHQLLSKVLAPLAGGWAAQRQLSQLNWSALGTHLQEISMLNDAQIQQILKWLKLAVRQILKKPRRWATRRQTQLEDFSSVFQGYIQNAEKSELNAASIQRSIDRILKPRSVDSESSAAALLSQIDRAKITKWLQQRSDLTEAEMSAIAPEIDSARQFWLDQAQQSQHQAQDMLNQTLAKIGGYLDSVTLLPFDSQIVKQNLDQWIENAEFNFADLSQSLRAVSGSSAQQLGDTLEDWGGSATQVLRDRLYQLSYDTVMGVLQSPKNLSETVQTQLQNQAEGLRDRLMQQVEHLQQETQKRLNAIKQQGQKRLEETRRAAAAAAWWLVAIASTAALTSALAGAWAAGLGAA
jgi:plasmid maintenance system antidote protein VapI